MKKILFLNTTIKLRTRSCYSDEKKENNRGKIKIKKQKIKSKLARERELYISTHVDSVAVSTIEDKCFVVQSYESWMR